MRALSIFTIFVIIAGLPVLFAVSLGVYLIVLLVTGAVLLIATTKGNALINYSSMVLVAETGRDNNKRLAILFLASIICFIVAFQTGGGDPLIYSTAREIVADKKFDSAVRGLSSWKNKIIWGIDLTGQEIDSAKRTIGFLMEKKPEELQAYKPDGQTENLRREEKKNIALFGIPATDKEIKLLLDKYALTDPPGYSMDWKSIGSWNWWQLGFLYLIFGVVYLPFAISDEVADLLEAAYEKIKSRKGGVEEEPVKEVAKETAKQTQGKFKHMLISDTISEVMVNSIPKFVSYLRR